MRGCQGVREELSYTDATVSTANWRFPFDEKGLIGPEGHNCWETHFPGHWDKRLLANLEGKVLLKTVYSCKMCLKMTRSPWKYTCCSKWKDSSSWSRNGEFLKCLKSNFFLNIKDYWWIYTYRCIVRQNIFPIFQKFRSYYYVLSDLNLVVSTLQSKPLWWGDGGMVPPIITLHQQLIIE